MKATYEITVYQGASYRQLDILEKRLGKYLAWKRAENPVSADGKITYHLRNDVEVTYFRDNPGKTLEIIAKGDENTIDRSLGLLKGIYLDLVPHGEINVHKYFGTKPKKQNGRGIGW